MYSHWRDALANLESGLDGDLAQTRRMGGQPQMMSAATKAGRPTGFVHYRRGAATNEPHALRFQHRVSAVLKILHLCHGSILQLQAIPGVGIEAAQKMDYPSLRENEKWNYRPASSTR